MKKRVSTRRAAIFNRYDSLHRNSNRTADLVRCDETRQVKIKLQAVRVNSSRHRRLGARVDSSPGGLPDPVVVERFKTTSHVHIETVLRGLVIRRFRVFVHLSLFFWVVDRKVHRNKMKKL